MWEPLGFHLCCNHPFVKFYLTMIRCQDNLKFIGRKMFAAHSFQAGSECNACQPAEYCRPIRQLRESGGRVVRVKFRQEHCAGYLENLKSIDDIWRAT